MRRFLQPSEMNRLSDHVERPDISRAAGEESEMVEGGYIADFTPAQMAYLKRADLPTGDAYNARQA
jgi:hypothetical protein